MDGMNGVNNNSVNVSKTTNPGVRPVQPTQQQQQSQGVQGNQRGLYSQIIGTRENIKLITKESYPQYGLDVEIIEYQKLLGSQNVYGAQAMWFMNEQNIKCRQIGLIISNNGVKIESGAMSYFQGPLQCSTGINSAGKLVSQMFTGKLTGEKVVMPEYHGSGILVLEPSFKHFLTLELGPGEQIICDKGMFFATSASVTVEPTWAGTASGAVLGGEGVFQQLITGPGVVILESPVPMCEINRIRLNNDILRVDGNFALLRTGGVQMSVEPVSQSLVGSAMSGEGLVNVFRGTGEVWVAPTIKVYDAINVARSLGGNIAAVDMNTSTGRAKPGTR